MIRPLIGACGMLLVLGACAQRGGAGQPGGRLSPGGLLKEAQSQYHLGDNIPARDDAAAKIDPTPAVEGLEVSTFKMKKKFLHFPKMHWVGAIRSNKAYLPMHLGPGLNYVFLDKKAADDAHMYVVVPEAPGYKPYYLIRDPSSDLAHGNPGMPLVIRKIVKRMMRDDAFVIGGCFECPQTGHCGTMKAGDEYIQ